MTCHVCEGRKQLFARVYELVGPFDTNPNALPPRRRWSPPRWIPCTWCRGSGKAPVNDNAARH